jgi:hypothetical protein
MGCITLTALETTMATTEVTRNSHGALMPWLPQQENNLHMNWVVVTGINGPPVLRSRWTSAKN